MPYAAGNVCVPPGGQDPVSGMDQQLQLSEQLSEPGGQAALEGGFGDGPDDGLDDSPVGASPAAAEAADHSDGYSPVPSPAGDGPPEPPAAATEAADHVNSIGNDEYQSELGDHEAQQRWQDYLRWSANNHGSCSTDVHHGPCLTDAGTQTSPKEEEHTVFSQRRNDAAATPHSEQRPTSQPRRRAPSYSPQQGSPWRRRHQ